MPLINHAGGGGGTPQLCSQVENFKVIPGSTALSARLSWEAPTVDEDSSFVGVRIVRKAGSAPEKVSDGTVVYEGTALTYTDTGLTAGTTYYYRAFAYNAKKKYQTARRVVSYVAINYDTTLENNSWATIHELSQKGYAQSIWSVGDTKSVILNGTVRCRVGTSSSSSTTDYMIPYTNATIDAFILGFNHNAENEGNNLIHFMLGKKNGKETALCSCSFGSGSYPRWKNETSRTITLGGGSTPSEPAENSLLAALPTDLRAVMQKVHKYYGYYDASESQIKVEFAEEYLSFPAVKEIKPNGWELELAEPYLKQYDYYKAGNRIRAEGSLGEAGEFADSDRIEYHTRSSGLIGSGSDRLKHYLYILPRYSTNDSDVWYDELTRRCNIRPIFFV